MKIISDFKDYYDSLQYYGGSDRSLLYQRKQVKYTQKFPQLEQALDEFISIFNIEKHPYLNWKYSDRYLGCKLGLLGFCGKLYPLFNSGYDSNISIVRLSKVACEVETWRAKSNLDLLKETVLLAEGINPVLDHAHVFLELNVPSFVYWATQDSRQDSLTTNPNLKDKDFQTILDAFSAYQELEQFLGGVLTNNPTLPEPSDSTKLQAHGFDSRSFKQVSPEKKFNRRNKHV